jgi:hypothetical protein
MSKKDHLKDWFRELPLEQASPDFSSSVMKQVMSEWTLNPYKYQPIISKKAWWTIGLIAAAITGILFSVHSSVSNYTRLSVLGIDFSQILSFLGLFFNKLNNISPAFAVGALAIIALWFFDQLFSSVKH